MVNGTGIAFDLGTTTVVGALVDIASGAVLGIRSAPNPQARWGSDVVSRMEAALSGGLNELTGAIREACNGIIEGLSAESGRRITVAALAGNSVMEHLFLGISPETLARVPYKPAFREARRLDAGLYGLALGCPLYVFPLIGGFVGGDAVAAAMATGLGGSASPALAVDIGTNSEIMLSSGGRLYATSAAAGPAFEGGELESGMVAGPGAIQGVSLDGDAVKLDVIGGVAPKGICGSGLIEAASSLLRAGVIERTGRIKDPSEIDNNLASRIRARGGSNSFVLYRGPSGEIALSQGDIRALQNAKSATKAGIEMLLSKAGIGPSDVARVYIAGAFGSHLKPEALREIGLLDAAWTDIVTAGDAALDGAIKALRPEGQKEAEDIAGRAKYVPLSGSAHFEEAFIRNINF